MNSDRRAFIDDDATVAVNSIISGVPVADIGTAPFVLEYDSHLVRLDHFSFFWDVFYVSLIMITKQFARGQCVFTFNTFYYL